MDEGPGGQQCCWWGEEDGGVVSDVVVTVGQSRTDASCERQTDVGQERQKERVTRTGKQLSRALVTPTTTVSVDLHGDCQL